MKKVHSTLLLGVILCAIIVFLPLSTSLSVLYSLNLQMVGDVIASSDEASSAPVGENGGDGDGSGDDGGATPTDIVGAADDDTETEGEAPADQQLLPDDGDGDGGAAPTPVEICGNGIDDDGDGLVDEENGRTGEPCPVEICGNGIDDDGDGVIDDINGQTGEACPALTGDEPLIELCGNGIDDDGDGLVDEECPIECPVGTGAAEETECVEITVSKQILCTWEYEQPHGCGPNYFPNFTEPIEIDVLSSSGSTSQAEPYTCSITGAYFLCKQVIILAPGEYEVRETSAPTPTGFELNPASNHGDWGQGTFLSGDCTGAIKLGETKECIITNVYLCIPGFTLTKYEC